MPSRILPMVSTVALNKNAFPYPQHDCRRTLVQFTPSFLAVVFKRKIRLSFALRSRAAQPLQPSRSLRPAFWNLSTGVALALENPIFDPLYAGVLHRCYGRNVVA